MITQPILIIGTGAQAKYTLDTWALRNLPILGLLRLPGERALHDVAGTQVLGTLDEFEEIYHRYDRPTLLIACSKNRVKEEVVAKLQPFSPQYANVIHPSAVISGSAVLGEGIIMNANAVVQPLAKIGNHVMIHAGVIVEHDCEIQDFVNLAPRVALAGYVKVGKGATVFTGAVAAPCVSIGEESIIGAGSVMLTDVPGRVTAVGAPARIVKNHEG